MNKEFNMRHDWNSLLSDDESLLFRHYSRDFFPHKQVMLDYLTDYTRKLGIRVLYNVDVSNVRANNVSEGESEGFSMTDQGGNRYRCR